MPGLGVLVRLRDRGVRLVRARRGDALVLVVDVRRGIERLLEAAGAEQRRRPPQPVDVADVVRDLDLGLGGDLLARSAPSGTAASDRRVRRAPSCRDAAAARGSPGRSAIRLTQCVGMSCSPSTNFTCVSLIGLSFARWRRMVLCKGSRAGQSPARRVVGLLTVPGASPSAALAARARVRSRSRRGSRARATRSRTAASRCRRLERRGSSAVFAPRQRTPLRGERASDSRARRRSSSSRPGSGPTARTACSSHQRRGIVRLLGRPRRVGDRAPVRGHRVLRGPAGSSDVRRRTRAGTGRRTEPCVVHAAPRGAPRSPRPARRERPHVHRHEPRRARVRLRRRPPPHHRRTCGPAAT